MTMSWTTEKAHRKLARNREAKEKQVYPYFKPFESGGLHNSCVVYALRLYVQDEAGALSKKDLNPDPKHVRLFHHHCCIL